MERLWLITNPGSGSTSDEKTEGIEAIFEERGLHLAGRTNFPEEGLPDIAELTAAQIDTVVLFAGDGTVNAAACKYDKWPGKALVLPGGTMNMLAKQLHGEADPHAIVHAAHERGTERPMPFVEAGPHRALCGLIIGPAATWAYAREAVRGGSFKQFRRGVWLAWQRTRTRSISLSDGKRRRGGYRAIMISPEDGWLRVSAFSTATFVEAARLGWEWMVGSWHDAPSVDDSRLTHVTVSGGRSLHALFDGEEVKLATPARISSGVSKLRFVSTIAEPEAGPAAEPAKPATAPA